MKQTTKIPDEEWSKQGSAPSAKSSLARRLGFFLLAVIGLVTGFVLYIVLLLDQPLQTDIGFVDPKKWQTVDLNEIHVSDSTESAAFSEGQRTRVYVHPDFPILKTGQKDPLVENILVFGIDARSADDVSCRADSLIIVTLDRRCHAIKLTSVMRDCQVMIHGLNKPDRIHAAYAYGGVGLLINTLNDQLDLDIQRFAMFDFFSAEGFIDAMGGVVIPVKEGEIPCANQSIAEQNKLAGGVNPSPLLEKEGLQRLNGRQAVAWARIRKLDSDAVRTSRQRILMTTLIQQAADTPLSTLKALANGGLRAFETNLRLTDMIRIGVRAVPLSSQILTYRVPEEGLYTINPNPWMMVVDWEKQKKKLHEFIWHSTP